MEGKWLHWASQLQSIAQAGLTFSNDRYDLDRYEKIRNITIEILHEYTDIDHNKIRDLFASDTGYQTPKVDIRASVFKDEKILMVREKVDGAWSLPGGWADVNTSVGESAVRECLEEAGFFQSDSLPALSLERNTRSQIEMCFEAKKHKVFETIFD